MSYLYTWATKHVGLFLVNDMQKPPGPPPPLSKVAKLSFRSRKMRNDLKHMQKQFSDFLNIFVFKIFHF